VVVDAFGVGCRPGRSTPAAELLGPGLGDGLGLTVTTAADEAGDALWDVAPAALADFSRGLAAVLAALAVVLVPAGAEGPVPVGTNGTDGWASANAGVAGQPTAARVIAAIRLAARSAHPGVLLLPR
jgi:hypothetical protein